MHHVICLKSQRSCVVLELEVGQAPVWRHYGARLVDAPMLYAWPAMSQKRLPPGTMDRLDGIPLVPTWGNGFHFGNAVRAHQDGTHGVQEFVTVDWQEHHSAWEQIVTIRLRDDTRELSAKLELLVTMSLHVATNVLSVDSELINGGEGVLQLDHLAAAHVGLAANLSEVGYFHGQWAQEHQWQRTALGTVGWHSQNRRGKTSHETPPTCYLLSEHSHDHSGEVVAVHLGWSGNHFLEVNRQDDGSYAVSGGEWLAPGEVRLEPGQSYRTPTLYVSWSDQGLNGVTANLHGFARQAILKWPRQTMRPRPVHWNTWEAIYFDHNPAVLQELAVRAAEIGVERFVLDDGWFRGRHDDTAGLGDWWPDPAKYPEGLGNLVAHVRALKMEFGLWVEPEMVNANSALFRAHPDWVLQSPGRAPQLGRQQLVVDLARPEVSEYLFDKFHALLSAHPISYLKWDMNRDLAQAENAQGRLVYGQQVVALYALLERLRAAHPTLEIESCASGGGRMDLGILRFTQRFWTSDNNDAVSRVAIQGGAARTFPLEVLGSHVGPAPAHATGRTQSMGFRCAVACFGHMGVESDLRHISASDKATLQCWIAIYKSWRGVLHTGTFSQGKTANGVWWLVQTACQCVLGMFTCTPAVSPHHAPVRLPQFVQSGWWHVSLLGEAGQERCRANSPAPWRHALMRGGVTISAAELVNVGLPVPNMNPESALVFALQRVVE